MSVKPDLEFIKYLKGAGGDTLKKCYQCATCSVMCPLSKDGSPFPRKEMIWSQWGLKENLIADPDVFLCHQCSDCSAYCPRGAKPGDVLGAIRAYAYTYYGWPGPLAKLASSAKGLPLLVGIPAVVIFVLWLLSSLIGVSGVHIPTQEEFASHGYTQFFGTWSFHWYAKNVFFILCFAGGSMAVAFLSFYMGATKLWKGMSKNADINSSFRPSVIQFVTQFLWPAIVEIVSHKRFKECGTQRNRATGHLPLMFAFMGLFIVTLWSLFKQDVLGLFWAQFHGPLPITDPFKILGNISAIALLFGIGVLWSNRKKSESENGSKGSFYDWFLIWLIAGVGVTGLGSELIRWMNIPTLGYLVYYMHLISVMMLFLYAPYTKMGHLVYRTVAMTFEKYRDSAFAKDVLAEK